MGGYQIWEGGALAGEGWRPDAHPIPGWTCITTDPHGRVFLDTATPPSIGVAMHTVTIRLSLNEGHDANKAETHDGLIEAVKTFEAVADAAVVGWSDGYDTPEPGGVAPDESNA